MTDLSLFPRLFSPFALGRTRLRNRIVHASMNTHMAEKTRVTERLINYHAERARGGAALIVTEPISMARHQNVSYRARAWNDDNLDDLKRWAQAVEPHDCRLLGQIQDPGRGRHNAGIGAYAIGPSALADDLSWTVPHALSAAEIRAMIEDFAESAARLQRCGFSGVEISSGHGHLFHQFLSPWSNAREDDYGGDVNGRTRIVKELIAALRSACGPAFLLGLKLPGNDWVKGGIDPAEAAAIASHLTAAQPLDYVCFAQGTHGIALERHLPDAHVGPLPYLELIRALRPALNGVPLVALGKIGTPQEAEAILAAADAELVGLGRPLLADAAWPLKTREGRTREIRQCVYCNICWDEINTHLRPMACVNNPCAGDADEADWWPARAASRRRVVVVGAGVAGMEAAWIAAARGHDVTVLSASSEAGGKLRLHWQLPGSEPLKRITEYQQVAAAKAGVGCELGIRAQATDVIGLKPDAVVLACGSTMLAPPGVPHPGAAHVSVPDLRQAVGELLCTTGKRSGTAVLFDMDHTEGTYAAAELMRLRFDRVVIITPREYIAQKTSMVVRQGILRRFQELRIEVVPLASPMWSESLGKATVVYANIYSGEPVIIRDVACFTYATPRVPDLSLYEPLRAAGIEVHRAGDCELPRGLLAATAGGHAIGIAV